MTCSAELPSSKRHEVVLKLPVLLLESREHVLLLSMGPYGTFRTVYSIAPAVTKKDTISCAVELSLRMRTFKCGGRGGLYSVDQVGGWAELGNGGAGRWSWGMCGARRRVSFFPEFLFFIPMVYFLRFNSILLCAAIMVKKIPSLAILLRRRGHICTRGHISSRQGISRAY